MSCHIKLAAIISNVHGVRRHLFPTDDSRGSDSWLQSCKTSVCPTGEIIVVANENRLVILTAKWDSSLSFNNFQISHTEVFQDDIVEGVLCLPVVGQSNSSHVGPDWKCIVVGFYSGFLRFYTDSCVLLFEEHVHDESVVGIKCQSQHSPRPDINSELNQEELYVLYSSIVAVINGSALFNTLRNCRSQLALVQARNEWYSPPEISINPKKWGFQDQNLVNDVAVVGLVLANTFDHLEIASTSGGFDTKYRAMPPNNSLVLAAGLKPFLGFHYALEGGAQPILSDVAKAVASKLKSALPGWLGGKAQPEKQVSTSAQPSEPMGCRFGLSDIRRTATSVTISPNKKIAAITDALGRVLLIDTHRGVTLRMFKGFREAQCAFIQVPDERKSKHSQSRRVALFLVIYSPKKGTIEIFTVQQGNKIATFAASKFSRLFYINYGLMGFANTTKSRYVCQFTCVLIDNDGKIKEVVIPFHFALSEKNSKRVRDIHLYKRLKQFIKTTEFDSEKLKSEILNTCEELKTVEVKQQCLEMLMASKEVKVEELLACATCLLANSKINQEEPENDLKNLVIVLENLVTLLNFYIFLTGPTTKEMDEKNGNVEEKSNTSFAMPVEEVNNLQKLLDLSTCKNSDVEMKVTFKDKKVFSLSDFLSVFDLNTKDSIILKENIEDHLLFKASEVIFKKYVAETLVDYEETKLEFAKSTIPVKNFFHMILNFWVNRPLNLATNLDKEIYRLSQIMMSLLQLIDLEEVTVEYNETSEFWSEIRSILVNSARPFPALTAAIVCRSVSQRIEDSEQQTDDSEIWEKLTQENCLWGILIGKLEDVALLNIIVSERLVGDSSCTLVKLKHDIETVSLKYVLEKGRGSVSELVARWLTTVGVNPEDIRDSEYPNDGDTSEEAIQDKGNSINEEHIFHHLNLVRKEFPYSLDSSILLSNMTWEYILAWQKEIDNLKLLEASFKCLQNINDMNIKQGVYSLLWNTHLRINFESCCKLINKVGKLPKSRLCEQDTRLGDIKIKQFLELCTNFLDEFMEVLQKSFGSPKKTLQYEPIWENSTGLPLAELALQQTETNYDIVHLHYQLGLVLLMMVTFEIKHSKPISNLFYSSVTSFFFTDVQKNAKIPWHKSDGKVNNSRLQFLFKVISSSIETITINEDAIFYTKHVRWMSKCLSLGRVWGLEVDLLKHFQIVQLFTNGWDSVAGELLPGVTDSKPMGVPLLEVAGKRMKHFLASSKDLGETISMLSPTLTNYMDTLNGDWCTRGKLEEIKSLAMQSLLCLTEDQLEYKLANLLIDACFALQDLQS